MTNKVSLVTDPDDVLEDSFRILLVGLNQIQTSIISDSLHKTVDMPNVVIYIWNNESLEWLFDKKNKSHLIVFNAETNNDELVGYFAAHSKAHYFGILKSLGIINNRVIHDSDEFSTILQKYIITYEQQYA
jgi:hypothetical protein